MQVERPSDAEARSGEVATDARPAGSGGGASAGNRPESAPAGPPAARSIAVGDVTCRVWEKGRGDSVAFLPGLGGLPRWSVFLDALATERHVAAPSLPGFPGADAIGELDEHLDWLVATYDVLQGAGVAGADLIGVSVGAALAADIAALWPGLVRRLVLVSPLGLFDAADPTADVFAQQPHELAGLLCNDPAAYEAHVAVPEDADRVEWTVQQTRAQEAAARLLWPVGDTRLARRLNRVTQPTLLVFGESDRVLPTGYRDRWQSAVPHAVQRIIQDAGHLVDLDAPQRLAEAVLEFLTPLA